MSRDKQIEEIYNDLCDAPTGSVNSDFTIGTLQESHTNLFIKILAGHLYSKGYRKTSDVAEEIFAEIESKKIFLKDLAGNIGIVVRLKDIAELKKKYTESEKDDGN